MGRLGGGGSSLCREATGERVLGPTIRYFITYRREKFQCHYPFTEDLRIQGFRGESRQEVTPIFDPTHKTELSGNASERLV